MENYTVVTSDSIEALISEVNNHIDQGWFPTGGVVIHRYGSNQKEFIQTMFRVFVPEQKVITG